MFSQAETASILDDAKRIGGAIGWSDRGVSLPTQDVLVQNLTKESQELVHKAIREHLLVEAQTHSTRPTQPFLCIGLVSTKQEAVVVATPLSQTAALSVEGDSRH